MGKCFIMLKINTVTMELKIKHILMRFNHEDNYSLEDATKELLNLFPVIKCQCIHEIEERFPSELINKKCTQMIK